MRTVEVEGYENPAKALANIVAGRIVSVAPHPQADRLRVVMTDIGQSEPVQIVCGGSNSSLSRWSSSPNRAPRLSGMAKASRSKSRPPGCAASNRAA